MSTNRILENKLKKIGFSEKESKIYILCLMNIKNTPTSLEKLSKYPRSTIYKILDSLKEKSFIYEKVTKKRKIYHTLDTEKSIENYLKLKIKEFDELKKNIKNIKPEIKKIEENIDKNISGEMKTFEGIYNLKEQILDKILENEKDMYWIGPSKIMLEIVELKDSMIRKKFSYKRLDTDVYDHGIITDEFPDNIYYKMKNSGEYKILKTKKKFSSVFGVSGNMLVILKKTNNIVKFYTIEDSNITELFKTFFKDY
jgi:sugar-specific transcriptional regulator TrmB